MADSPDLRTPASTQTSEDLAPDQQCVDLEPPLSSEEWNKLSRRSFLSGLSGLGAAGIFSGAAPLAEAEPKSEPAVDVAVEGQLTLRVNGKQYKLHDIDPRATLLDTLRERLYLTGT